MCTNNVKNGLGIKCALTCTKVLIYLPARCGAGRTTISWPTNDCKRACCYFQAGHGDFKTLEGNEKLRTLKLSPCMRDCPVLTEGHQCQAAENIFDRDDIHDLLGCWLIEELCSRVSGLPPILDTRQIYFCVKLCTLVRTFFQMCTETLVPAISVVVQDVHHSTLLLTYVAIIMHELKLE